jgi:pectinesterase
VKFALLALVIVAGPVRADAVVAADGSGQFRTVQAAVDAAPSHARTRLVIHVRPGIYKERVVVPPDKTFLTLRGDDPRTTVITYDLHAGLPGPKGRVLITFDTPTVFIQADDFTAENLTFENSAGPQGQALALTIMSDRGVFRNCRFLGYQDTLLAQAGRQYFDHCYIEGAVDFIFGGSAAYFDHCEIYVKANGYITAANTPKDQAYGYVFSNAKITGAPGVKTYLGRPWRPYAATVFLNAEMSTNVRPEGWNNWNDPAKEKTARYAEYRSSSVDARLPWAHRLTDAEATAYTLENVLGGLDGWDPKTGTVRSRIQVEREPAAKPAPLGKSSALIATTAGNELAYSTDGYKWNRIARRLPTPSVGQKQMKNPSVLNGPDGVFHLVWATGLKGDKGFGYAASRDLVHWSDQRYIEIMAKENALDLASPHLFYDQTERRFVVTWASTIAQNAIQAFQEEVENNPRIWYATTRDFQTFSDPQVLFDPNYSVKDAMLLKNGARFALVHNDNARPMQSLRVAFSDGLLGPWGPRSDAFTARFTDSPAAVKLGEEWWIYDANTQTGAAGLVKTRGFQEFTDASGHVQAPLNMRLISIVEAGRALLQGLLK